MHNRFTTCIVDATTHFSLLNLVNLTLLLSLMPSAFAPYCWTLNITLESMMLLSWVLVRIDLTPGKTEPMKLTAITKRKNFIFGKTKIEWIYTAHASLTGYANICLYCYWMRCNIELSLHSSSRFCNNVLYINNSTRFRIIPFHYF